MIDGAEGVPFEAPHDVSLGWGVRFVGDQKYFDVAWTFWARPDMYQV